MKRRKLIMDEYINKKELEEAFDNADPDVCENYTDGHSDWGFGRENVRDVIRGVPAADVAPVVHGRWETNSDRPDTLICAMCKCGFDMWKHDPHNYCPNCGARMDGEEDGSD